MKKFIPIILLWASPAFSQELPRFAEIDANGVVLRVIVADQTFINTGLVGKPSQWVATSMIGGARKNYAGIGYTYTRDMFVPPKAYSSWELDEATGHYRAPVQQPTDGKYYEWDEAARQWRAAPPPSHGK